MHHHHHAPTSYNRIFGVVMLLNAGYFALQIFVALYMANSIALYTDALHNLGDIAVIGASWIGHALMATHHNSKRTFGWKGVSKLVALANSVFLLAITGKAMWDAFERLQSPEWVSGEAVGLTAFVGIGLNLASAKLLHGGSQHDMNMRTAYVHQVIDVAQSGAVVLAGLTIVLSGWELVDPIAGLAISALVIMMVWSIFKEAVTSAVQGVPGEIDTLEVIGYLKGLPGVIQVHNLHVFAVSTVATTLTTHVVVDRGTILCLHDIEHGLAEFGISDFTIQPELVDDECRHREYLYGRADSVVEHVH